MRQVYSRQLALTTGFLAIAVAAVFALIQSPEILESPRLAAVTVARSLPHPLAGFENCESCHGREGMKPYPISHLGWKNESCLKCHRIPGQVSSPGIQLREEGG